MPSAKILSSRGSVEHYKFHGEPVNISAVGEREWNREVFAAAHVVASPTLSPRNSARSAIDWDSTLAYRDYLWDLGFGVAEALDTAQRGMGVDWSDSLELINRSVAHAKSRGNSPIVCGAGTDQLSVSTGLTLQDVTDAYLEQCEAIEAVGGKVVLMASRALVFCARTPDDYLKVYSTVLSQLREPAILHWLGEMFDPLLHGYWGSKHFSKAAATCLQVIASNQDKVRGIKISLLSLDKEIELRKKLPESVRMFTGDDFNYPELIAGDSMSYSHALLGIFDAIAPVAAVALTHLAQGNEDAFFNTLNPTVPLSRLIFSAPTKYYKTGITFIAYLNGHQDHFSMIGGYESARDLEHLSELVRLADCCGVLVDPDLAAERVQKVLGMRLSEIS